MAKFAVPQAHNVWTFNEGPSVPTHAVEIVETLRVNIHLTEAWDGRADLTPEDIRHALAVAFPHISKSGLGVIVEKV